MTKRERGGAVAALAVTSLLRASDARAQQRPARQARPDPTPDASVVIQQVRVGVSAVGGGRLHLRGEEYSSFVRGLEFGSVGVSTLSASGEVFNLHRLEDFPGRCHDRAALKGSGA